MQLKLFQKLSSSYCCSTLRRNLLVLLTESTTALKPNSEQGNSSRKQAQLSLCAAGPTAHAYTTEMRNTGNQSSSFFIQLFFFFLSVTKSQGCKIHVSIYTFQLLSPSTAHHTFSKLYIPRIFLYLTSDFDAEKFLCENSLVKNI